MFFFETRNDEIFSWLLLNLPEGLIRGFHQIYAFFGQPTVTTKAFFAFPSWRSGSAFMSLLPRSIWEKFPKLAGFLYHQIRWVVEPTHLKNMLVKMGSSFTIFEVKIQKYLKPQPRSPNSLGCFCWSIQKWISWNCVMLFLFCLLVY